MNPFFENWFQSLDKGLEKLSPQECRCLFSECAAQCGKDALKYLYQNLFEDCNGNLDVFFSRWSKAVPLFHTIAVVNRPLRNSGIPSLHFFKPRYDLISLLWAYHFIPVS